MPNLTYRPLFWCYCAVWSPYYQMSLRIRQCACFPVAISPFSPKRPFLTSHLGPCQIPLLWVAKWEIVGLQIYHGLQSLQIFKVFINIMSCPCLITGSKDTWALNANWQVNFTSLFFNYLLFWVEIFWEYSHMSMHLCALMLGKQSSLSLFLKVNVLSWERTC